jgi:hypothetical protein
MRNWLHEGIDINGNRVIAKPRRIELDPSAASFREQLFRDHLSPHRADNDVSNGIRTVATLLNADKLKISSNCAGLIDEFPGYRWDDKAAAKGEDKVIKVADHSLDALRYGIYSTRHSWNSKLGLATV